MTEKWLAVILWYNTTDRKGVLADLDGTTYVFRDVAQPHDTYIRGPVFPNGWQPLTRPGTLKDGSLASWTVTEPTIIEFSVEYFRYREDETEGAQILSVAPASDFTQQDYETLIAIREEYDATKRAERKARFEAAQTRGLNNGLRGNRH